MATILVIEDDALFREMIVMALEEAGFETREADAGPAALALVRDILPDVVLCDVHLPEMDGYDVLARLREDPATASVPVILMTGLADDVGRREGMNQGADDYLPKPFNVADLLASVEARLQTRAAIRRQAEERLDALRASISMALPHELRTPLTSILSGSEVIMTHGPQMRVRDICEMASIVHRAGQRLSRLVENFLIYAQLEILARDPRQVMLLRQSETSNPQTVLREAAHAVAERHRRPDDLDLDLAGCPVRISDVYLEKIVAELLDNAFKFSEAGSTVSLQARPLDGGLRLRICDRGTGMDAAQVRAVGAYMQFERKLNEQQGSGLGLHLARQLTYLHEGHLTIQSEPGVGTSVEVWLAEKSGHAPMPNRPIAEPARRPADG